MKRAARLAAFWVGGLIFVPYSVSFLEIFAGLLVMTLGLVALYECMNDDLTRARSSLIAALGLIVLIETLAPLDWRALFG